MRDFVAGDEGSGRLGWKRFAALSLLLAAVAAVAYLDKAVAAGFDLKLVYFLIAISAAVLLPGRVALAVAVAVAVTSGAVSGLVGLPEVTDILSRLLIYGYAALLTSNWERERRKLMLMSRVDELTGLYNLRGLREQMAIWLGPAVRTGRSMAVLMLDVDGFKAVNDRLGHTAGNELLREVANVLRVSVRVGDSLFRFGGDEFVLLLSDTDMEGARAVGKRIQNTYHSMHQTQPASGVGVTLSLGIAVFPRDGGNPESLLTHADEALYAAKAMGRGEIVEYKEPAAA